MSGETDTLGRKRRHLLLILVTLTLLVAWASTKSTDAQDPEQPRRATDESEVLAEPAEAFLPAADGSGPLLGIGFISSVEDPADAQQYANALSTGVGWNRWPLYWSGVETAEGQFYWDRVDAVVRADVGHGLESNVILMGTPCFYREDRCGATTVPVERPAGTLSITAAEAARPDGLYAPIFSDGTDVPGSQKQINPENVWARFVFAAVDRYRPGGTIDLPPGAGVRAWEIWNEPDLEMFWDNSEADYARLLKVGYLATKHADPEARVIVGGLAYFEEDGFFELVLRQFDREPLAQAHGYFHDVVAVHNYLYSWSSWWYVYRTEQTLASRGLQKEIWLNESGVPAWDDYPGPVWDPGSAYRSTKTEQADFIIQNAFYATYAGADGIFHFQLYDGCGNQPAGTDFPPHMGDLCDGEGRLSTNPYFPCAGDAFGLFSNPTDAVCFTQHPTPESARPAANAIRVLAQEFYGVEPLWRLRPGGSDPYNGPQEWIAFYRPSTRERVLGLWTRFGTNETAVVPAAGTSARLRWPNGDSQILTPQGGNYTIALPGATNQNAPWDSTLYPIGGKPAILIEIDDIPPTLSPLAALPLVSGDIYVGWRGDDGLGSGLTGFDVLVSLDGGPARPVVTGTLATYILFPAEAGQSYTFTVVARDLAGNVSPARTATVLAGLPAGAIWMPLVAKQG